MKKPDPLDASPAGIAANTSYELARRARAANQTIVAQANEAPTEVLIEIRDLLLTGPLGVYDIIRLEAVRAELRDRERAGKMELGKWTLKAWAARIYGNDPPPAEKRSPVVLKALA